MEAPLVEDLLHTVVGRPRAQEVEEAVAHHMVGVAHQEEDHHTVAVECRVDSAVSVVEAVVVDRQAAVKDRSFKVKHSLVAAQLVLTLASSSGHSIEA